MFQNQETSLENHRRFVERVSASGEVWGLRCTEGWATVDANGEKHEGRGVIPFWSDRAYAKRAARDEWAEHEPTRIPLDKFLSAWLPGMRKEGTLAGTNWDAHNCGREVEPLELAEELDAEIRRRS